MPGVGLARTSRLARLPSRMILAPGGKVAIHYEEKGDDVPGVLQH